MKESLEKAIKKNAENSCKDDIKSDDALKFTQAALNAANALRCIADK